MWSLLVDDVIGALWGWRATLRPGELNRDQRCVAESHPQHRVSRWHGGGERADSRWGSHRDGERRLLTDSPLRPGVELRANLKSISHKCQLFEVSFVWELIKEAIHLPLGCLQDSPWYCFCAEWSPTWFKTSGSASIGLTDFSQGHCEPEHFTSVKWLISDIKLLGRVSLGWFYR